MTRNELHDMIDRLPDETVDGAGRLLQEIVQGRIDPDQAWFWTPGWQATEREADADLAAGRLTVFEGDDQFLSALDARMRP
jgi:hypothetical protein